MMGRVVLLMSGAGEVGKAFGLSWGVRVVVFAFSFWGCG